MYYIESYVRYASYTNHPFNKDKTDDMKRETGRIRCNVGEEFSSLFFGVPIVVKEP